MGKLESLIMSADAESRLILLASIFFNPTQKALARMTVRELRHLIRRRLTGNTRIEAVTILDKAADALDRGEDQFLTISPHYKGKYPVERHTIAKRLKVVPQLRKMIASKGLPRIAVAMTMIFMAWIAPNLPADRAEKAHAPVTEEVDFFRPD